MLICHADAAAACRDGLAGARADGGWIDMDASRQFKFTTRVLDQTHSEANPLVRMFRPKYQQSSGSQSCILLLQFLFAVFTTTILRWSSAQLCSLAVLERTMKQTRAGLSAFPTQQTKISYFSAYQLVKQSQRQKLYRVIYQKKKKVGQSIFLIIYIVISAKFWRYSVTDSTCRWLQTN